MKKILDEKEMAQTVLYFKSVEEAICFLDKGKNTILLTVSLKEMAKYTHLSGFKERVFCRIAPFKEAIETAITVGYQEKQLICMHGPFSKAFNIALINQLHAKIMIAEASEDSQTLELKYCAAKEAGIKLLIVGKVQKAEGLSFEECLERFGLEKSQAEQNDPKAVLCKNKKLDWFPFFKNIKDQKIVIIGGGNIATRRIRTLLDFSCKLTVISPKISKILSLRIAEFHYLKKEWELKDIDNADYVIVATNDNEINEKIVKRCKEKNIPVNNASKKEDCDFYFPSIIAKGNLTIGLTAQGKNHCETKKCREKIEKSLL